MYTVKQLRDICKLVGNSDPECTIHWATDPQEENCPLWFCNLFLVDLIDDFVYIEAAPDAHNVRMPKPFDLYVELAALPPECDGKEVRTSDWECTADTISYVYYDAETHKLSLITNSWDWQIYIKLHPDSILLK